MVYPTDILTVILTSVYTINWENPLVKREKHLENHIKKVGHPKILPIKSKKLDREPFSKYSRNKLAE